MDVKKYKNLYDFVNDTKIGQNDSANAKNNLSSKFYKVS